MEKTFKLINTNSIASLLERFCGFSGLTPEELSALIQLSDIVHFRTGQEIVREGDEDDHCLYIILRGRVLVSAGLGNHEIEMARMEEGDFFGEISLVDDGPRSARVTALEDCTLLRVTRMTIGVLAGLHANAAIQILSAIGQALVKRLRTSNLKYLDVLLRTGNTE